MVIPLPFPGALSEAGVSWQRGGGDGGGPGL